VAPNASCVSHVVENPTLSGHPTPADFLGIPK
jgi:hypothetical protein